ncbi:hypothetical protein R3P38DRAFT_3371222 [Favolaschia claudopus]|uniref:Uncharacterized protein n=1 Tax=Favolaschia claudopus TaxID=2862362 RepID=A0AAV9ZYK8_9AGAR
MHGRYMCMLEQSECTPLTQTVDCSPVRVLSLFARAKNLRLHFFVEAYSTTAVVTRSSCLVRICLGKILVRPSFSDPRFLLSMRIWLWGERLRSEEVKIGEVTDFSIYWDCCVDEVRTGREAETARGTMVEWSIVRRFNTSTVDGVFGQQFEPPTLLVILPHFPPSLRNPRITAGNHPAASTFQFHSIAVILKPPGLGIRAGLSQEKGLGVSMGATKRTETSLHCAEKGIPSVWIQDYDDGSEGGTGGWGVGHQEVRSRIRDWE